MRSPSVARALSVALGLALASPPAHASKRKGPEVNTATVQSAPGGAMYVRAVPADDLGAAGTTEVYAVGRDGDALVDRYPYYLRGALHLAWSPISGHWCVVQLEPLRLVADSDWRLSGTLDHLSFHCGGQRIRDYTRAELEAMGLRREVVTLVYERPGDVLVRGVEQVGNTNDYVFALETVDASRAHVTRRFDIRTGLPYQPAHE